MHGDEATDEKSRKRPADIHGKMQEPMTADAESEWGRR